MSQQGFKAEIINTGNKDLILFLQAEFYLDGTITFRIENPKDFRFDPSKYVFGNSDSKLITEISFTHSEGQAIITWEVIRTSGDLEYTSKTYLKCIFINDALKIEIYQENDIVVTINDRQLMNFESDNFISDSFENFGKIPCDFASVIIH